MADVKTATQIYDDEIRRAVNMRKADLRARQIVDMCVARAMHERDEPEERDFRRYAHDVALDATAILIRHFYEDDAEMRFLREQVEYYRKTALGFAQTAPIPPIETRSDETAKQAQPEG